MKADVQKHNKIYPDMGLRIGIGNIKINQHISWSSYWETLLDLWYKLRSGVEFEEFYTDNAFPAKILSACALCDATHYWSKVIAGGLSYMAIGNVKAHVYWNGTSLCRVFTSCDFGTASHLIQLLINDNGTVSIYLRELAVTNIYTTTNAISIGWHTIKWESDGSVYTISVDDSIMAGTATTGSNNGKWFNWVTGRDNVAVGVTIYNSTTLASDLFYIDYLNINDTNIWYFNGLRGTELDIIGDILLTLTGAIEQVFIEGAGLHYLDVGFSVWEKAGNPDWLIPYISENTPYAGTVATVYGYTLKGNYAGATDGIIKGSAPPCIIGFNETGDADSRLAIFDRSNTTRQENISRSSDYYDDTSLATKCRYHSSEILYIAVIESLFKIGYKHRIFPINDDLENPTKVTGFMIAKTDLT